MEYQKERLGQFKMISRQRKWQLKKMEQGLCACCGKRKQFKDYDYCEVCKKKILIRNKIQSKKHRGKKRVLKNEKRFFPAEQEQV